MSWSLWDGPPTSDQLFPARPPFSSSMGQCEDQLPLRKCFAFSCAEDCHQRAHPLEAPAAGKIGRRPWAPAEDWKSLPSAGEANSEANSELKARGRRCTPEAGPSFPIWAAGPLGLGAPGPLGLAEPSKVTETLHLPAISAQAKLLKLLKLCVEVL